MVKLRTGKISNTAAAKYNVPDKKKAKAANCVYLDESRICTNPHSVRYADVCKIASYCPLRVKEDLVVKIKPKPVKKEVRLLNEVTIVVLIIDGETGTYYLATEPNSECENRGWERMSPKSELGAKVVRAKVGDKLYVNGFKSIVVKKESVILTSDIENKKG